MEEMSRCLSRRELLAALLLFALLTLLTPSALGAHVAQMSGSELAAASANVRYPANNGAWSNADITLTVK